MKRYILAFVLFLTLQLHSQVNNQQSDFLVKPYLQIGKTPSPQSLQLLWHAAVSNDTWLVEYKNRETNDWMRSQSQASTKITITGIEPFLV